MDRDTYMAANQVIKRYGNDAEDHAYICMLELLDADDEKGASVWNDIMQAIQVLQSEDATTKH